MIKLDLFGIIVIPYVRMTTRGKFVSHRAQRYLASQDILAAKIKNQMQLQGKAMMPGQTPLSVVIRLYAPSSPGHKCDLDNQVKAVLDACKGIAFPDDRWVDQIDAQRFIGVKPRLKLMIMKLERFLDD